MPGKILVDLTRKYFLKFVASWKLKQASEALFVNVERFRFQWLKLSILWIINTTEHAI